MTDTQAPTGTETVSRGGRVRLERRELVERVETYVLDLPDGMTVAEFRAWCVRDPKGFDEYVTDAADPDHEDYDPVDDNQLAYRIH